MSALKFKAVLRPALNSRPVQAPF